MIAKTAVMEFKNNLMLARSVSRVYKSSFNNQTGYSIRIREPVRLLATPGRFAKVSAVNERFKTLEINRRFNVAVAITDEQFTLQLADFNDSIIRPAMQTLANQVDADLYAEGARTFYNYGGTAGTPPSTLASISQIGAQMDAMGIPREDRFAALSPKDGDSFRMGLTSYFDPSFVDPILKERAIGRVAGFRAFTAQNVQRPIVAVPSSPYTITANQVGNMLTVGGVPTGTIIKAGTVFKVAGVDFVNRISYGDSGYQQGFVVTADTTSGSGNTIYVPISPSIVTSGPYQTVTNSPAVNSNVTFQPTHTANLCYHKQAFTLAMIDLYEPPTGSRGVQSAKYHDADSNISIRMLRYFDGNASQETIRFDIFYGLLTFPEFGWQYMGS